MLRPDGVSQYWILAIIEKGFLHHLSIHPEKIRATKECLTLMAPKFGVEWTGDLDVDWGHLEEARSEGDDGFDYEFYIETFTVPFAPPGGIEGDVYLIDAL